MGFKEKLKEKAEQKRKEYLEKHGEEALRKVSKKIYGSETPTKEQIIARARESIDQSTITKLTELFPQGDEILHTCICQIKKEDLGMYVYWNTPVLSSRSGVSIIYKKKGEYIFQFTPWTGLKKVGKVAGQKGLIMSKHRGWIGTHHLYLAKNVNEPRDAFKQRRKEFYQFIPQLFKEAKKAQIIVPEKQFVSSQLGGFDLTAAEFQEELFDDEFDWSEEIEKPSKPADSDVVEDEEWEWD